MTNSIRKPFLKWVGGKTQIIDKIMDKFPKEINNYYEPFLGGGSVLFALLSFVENKKIKVNGSIYAYDLNERLINVYKHIQNNKDELWGYLSNIINEYNSIEIDSLKKVESGRKKINPLDKVEGLLSKEHYYYYIRNLYNDYIENDIEISAMFIFLNKTCFRGVYRESKNGFNVPYGNYNNPNIIDKNTIDIISNMIQNVIFIKSSFNESLDNEFNEGDFLYLDPPYAPENNKSFVGYTKDGFTYENHIELFDMINFIKDMNVKFVMSNASVNLVINNFKDCHIDSIKARRAINSKKPESKTTEILVYN
jgi:DNA adenine methylase